MPTYEHLLEKNETLTRTSYGQSYASKLKSAVNAVTPIRDKEVLLVAMGIGQHQSVTHSHAVIVPSPGFSTVTGILRLFKHSGAKKHLPQDAEDLLVNNKKAAGVQFRTAILDFEQNRHDVHCV